MMDINKNNTITGTATENIVKAYIVESDYFSNTFDDNTEHLSEFFVITGNNDFKSFNLDNRFYDKSMHLITDIQCYYDTDSKEGIQEIVKDYNITFEDVNKICNIIESANDTESPEILVDIINIISDKTYECCTIRGYCQRDWNYIIYDTDIENDVDMISSYYFGKYKDVKIVTFNADTDDYEECWSTITDSDLWKNETNISELKKILNIPNNSEIYIEDGYSNNVVKNFKKIS